MKNQTIFNKVLEHIRSMKHQSLNASGNCVYRTPDGNKCAVGCLIPNKDYSPKMDNIDSTEISSVWHRFKALKRLFKDDQLELLRDLQKVHDDICNWSERGFVGNQLMRIIARKHGLQYTPKNA